jgi:hypothetical protein
VTETPGAPPASLPPVQYKGGDLDAGRGPGLGCFYVQLVVLVLLVVLTPLSAYAGWPPIVSTILLFVTIALLLLTGQTIIFLLRLVAAERREGRRRPMASRAARSETVGELDDERTDEAAPDQKPVEGEPPMRQ